MAEGVGAGIAVALRVGSAAYAEGIQDEDECARHRGPPREVGLEGTGPEVQT